MVSGGDASKVAIVTGAARGLGRAIALRLARDGTAVSVWDLNAEGARDTARMIVEAGGWAIAVQANSAKADEIACGLAETHTRFASDDVAVEPNSVGRFGLFTTPTPLTGSGLSMILGSIHW